MRVTQTIFAVLLFSSPAMAQLGNPGFMAPGSADAPARGASAMTNTTDQLFTRLAAQGGSGEVDLARLAQRKGRNSAVQEFADRMVGDHGKSNAQLSTLARQKDIDLQRGMDPDQARVKDELDRLNGAAFDVRYMEAQITDHMKTAQLLEWEIGQGQNADIQHFAADTLPVVLLHLDMARTILLQLRGVLPSERRAAERASK